jgi:uncharacterized protein YhfF
MNLTKEQLETLTKIGQNHILLDHDDNPFFVQMGVTEIIKAYEKMKCNHEFIETDSNQMLLSNPPKKREKCNKCGEIRYVKI